MTIATQPFPQNVIAVIWDFDKTLIPGYMQRPIFERYGVDETDFWKEVNERAAYYQKHVGQVSSEIVYLNHIIDYVKKGIFKGLNNATLREMGKELTFYPGLPDFFRELTDTVHNNKEYKRYDIELEHYVVSTGLRQIILGSRMAQYLTDVWGCEFLEEENEENKPSLAQIGYVLDHTTKTRAVFEINKGVNKESTIDVNARMSDEHRRVPISQMIYIADGPSDVPVFSVLKQNGGKNLAVYPPDVHSDSSKKPAYEQVYNLQQDDRVNHMSPADFTENSDAYIWLKTTVGHIADRIVKRQESAIRENIGKPLKHV